LNGTNYVSGSGFCFGDQQMKEGTPLITCTSSGFPPEANFYAILWSIDNSRLSEAQVNAMYPGRINAMPTQQAGEFQLSILNVTSLGVSTVACRITALNSSFDQVGRTPETAQERISVIYSKCST
jgi:hypothetical protein